MRENTISQICAYGRKENSSGDREMKLADLIKDRLEVSIRQMERETGISRSTISNIRDGKGTPYIHTIKKICKYFGVDWKDYVED